MTYEWRQFIRSEHVIEQCDGAIRPNWYFGELLVAITVEKQAIQSCKAGFVHGFTFRYPRFDRKLQEFPARWECTELIERWNSDNLPLPGNSDPFEP